MFRKMFCVLIGGVLPLVSAEVWAGGPPWLCIPLKGVTAENSADCAKLLNEGLQEKFWPHAGRPKGVRIQQSNTEWYATFYMGKAISLSEVEAALKDSPFSVPRERLRFFGHVELDLKAPEESINTLRAEVDDLPHVGWTQSKRERGSLRVTIDMPYPRLNRVESHGTIDWEDQFGWTDFNSAKPTKSAISARSLPSYGELSKWIKQSDAELKDICWSPNYGCRPLGSVVVSTKTKDQ